MIHYVETTSDEKHEMSFVTFNKVTGEYPLTKQAPGRFKLVKQFTDLNPDISHRDACRFAAQVRDAGRENGGARPVVRVRSSDGEVSFISQRLRYRDE